MRKEATLAWLLILSASVGSAEAPLEGMSAQDLAEGQRLFRVHCARCHGIDGGGGEGANLARPKLRFAPDDEALLAVIADGIPGTGMPSVWSLDAEQAKRVAAYVRSLGRLSVEAMPGDPTRGAEIYRTTGGCPACHIVAGHGKGIGPELTDVGDRRGVEYLRRSLLAPAEAQSQTMGYRDFLTVRVRTKRGEIEGLRINEDAFSIQLRDAGGRIHSLRKDELLGIEKVFAHSLMPGYGDALSPADIDDVVSYLMSLRSES